MKVAAVIAEYNPFHNGHKYHLDMTRRLTGADGVLVIMSGDYVQRGEPAIAAKRDRAKAALINGADLVIELPVPWSIASAERFARAGVYLAIHTGMVDCLSFGAETADTGLLTKVADFCSDRYYAAKINDRYDSRRCSYPEARAEVVREELGAEADAVLSEPNNILAVEYIKALRYFRSSIEPVAVERFGAGHDSSSSAGFVLPALGIRTRVENGADFLEYMPGNAAEIIQDAIRDGHFPALPDALEVSLLADMRRKRPEDLLDVPDVAEGIENRICEVAQSAATLKELYSGVKTKRYAYSRIRRIVLNSWLGVTKSDVESLPPYLRVLGFNETGQRMLREIQKNLAYPVVIRYKDVLRLGNFPRHIFELGSTAADLYNLTFPVRRPGGCDKTDEVVVIGK